MKKYYYTDALAACWMERHFKMRFENDNPRSGDKWAEGKSLLHLLDKYYIHPDSEKLLELQNGDVVYEAFDSVAGVVKAGFFQSGKAAIERTDQAFTEASLDEGTKIIQRNGKPFFWPEVEDAE